jgi:hypothetical protein
MNMKTIALPAVAFLAVIAAFAFLAVSAVAATIAFSVAGIVLVAVADYGRNLKPLRAESRVIPFDEAGRPADDLRDAA